MVKTLKAKVSGGLLEPLEPLELKEGSEVTLTIIEPPAEVSAGGDPTTETAGAWSDTVDCERLVADIYASRLTSNRPGVSL